jgi:hypothetical protein
VKRYAIVLFITIVAIGAVIIAQNRSSKTKPNIVATPDPTPAGAAAFSGKVVETMDAGGYTYVCVETGKEKIWAAGPETKIEVGETVSFPMGMEMTDFHSETLDRTFESILFVNTLQTGATGASNPHMPSGHPPVSSPQSRQMDFTGIQVPSGGKNIASLYAEKTALAGKEVVVRGKVVKYTPGIMDRNWIHIQDGTGEQGANDLTVTTDAAAEVGNTVVVRGVMAIDRDFGLGYTYEIIVENAKVTVENPM